MCGCLCFPVIPIGSDRRAMKVRTVEFVKERQLLMSSTRPEQSPSTHHAASRAAIRSVRYTLHGGSHLAVLWTFQSQVVA